jgi:hypothetical protein
MVHVGGGDGVNEVNDDDDEEQNGSVCWRGGVDRADVRRFGWRQLAITLMKRRCFQCGAQPSFVVFLDNTRKCQKCINTEKLRREIDKTRRWEHELVSLTTTTADDDDDADMPEVKRLKTVGCVSGGDAEQRRRAIKVSRRLTRLAALLGEAGKHADAETLLLEVLTRDIALHG